jgi:hypothetical protein
MLSYYLKGALVLTTSLLVSSSTALAVSNQPWICAPSFPQGMPYWVYCSMPAPTQALAQACSINGWEVGVLFADGPDYTNWNIVQNRQIKSKQDASGYWTVSVHATPCKYNPFYRPPTGQKP